MLRRAGDERGAVAPFVAVMMVPIMLVGALAIDIGLQRVARADAQALADVVALDLSWELGDRTVSQLEAVESDLVAQSVANNPDVIGDSVPELDVRWGQMNGDGEFTPLGGGAVATAVSVEAGASVAFAFSGFTGLDEGDAQREAVSTSESGACFRLGSFAAALNSGDSVIADVFEYMMADEDALDLNLRAIGYQGLATAFIQLDELAAAFGVGTVDALISRGDVSVAGLLAAGAEVLSDQGESGAAAALGAIAARVRADVTADVGDILAVGDGAAASSSVNALDLLGWSGLAAAAAAAIADQNNFLSTGVVWSVPHTSGGEVALTVIEPPRQACGHPGGPERASTGQLKMNIGPGFNLPNKLTDSFNRLNVMSIDSAGTQTQIAIAATIAGAEGRLTGMECGDDRQEIRVQVETRLTDVSANLPFRVQGSMSPIGIVPARLLPTGVAERLLSLELQLVLTASARVRTASTTSGETIYSVPPRNYLDPEPSPGSGGLLELVQPSVSIDLSRSSARLLVAGIPTQLSVPDLNLSGLLSNVSSSVIGTSLSEVVNNINGALRPLASLLGLRLAGADVYGVPGMSCGVPRLVG